MNHGDNGFFADYRLFIDETVLNLRENFVIDDFGIQMFHEIFDLRKQFESSITITWAEKENLFNDMYSLVQWIGYTFDAVSHRSRMNPSRSEIICNPILINIITKITLNDLIDTHGLRFVLKSRILKV